jgi:hypothetical protein
MGRQGDPMAPGFSMFEYRGFGNGFGFWYPAEAAFESQTAGVETDD